VPQGLDLRTVSVLGLVDEGGRVRDTQEGCGFISARQEES